MKKLYVSHSVKSLATQFSKDISQMYSNPFAPLEILIPSGGLEHWLKSEMAEQNGVFCNFQYINYDDLLHKLYALPGLRCYASSSLQIHLAFFLFFDSSVF